MVPAVMGLWLSPEVRSAVSSDGERGLNIWNESCLGEGLLPLKCKLDTTEV